MKIFGLLTILLSLNTYAQLRNDQIDHQALDESLLRPYKNKAVENQRLNVTEGIEDLADVVIVVNRAPKNSVDGAQTLKAYHYGVLVREVSISTGKWGHATPVGNFRPIYTNHMRIYKDYFSGAYSGSPMKWAIFFIVV